MSIRVLHIFNEFLPESENWAFNLISNSENIDHHIAAAHYLDNQFLSKQFSYVKNYYDKPLKRYRVLKNSNPIHFLQKIWIRSLPIVRGYPETHFYEFAIDNKIDVIHIHFADVAIRFLSKIKRPEIPIVVSFYGWDYEKLPHTKPWYKKRYRMLFDTSDRILCEGEHGRQILENYGCPIEKIGVQKLGITVSNTTEEKKKNKKPEELKLVQLSSFLEKKGQIYTLQAFHRATKNCPNMRLTLAGHHQDPVITNQIRDYIEKHNLSEIVELKSAIPFSELDSFLSDFDVFIHPSCYAKDRDCEGGAPVVLLNAQSCGVPIISTYHCDIPSYVEENKTGRLAHEKDVAVLASHIEYFYGMDNDKYSEYSSRAKNFIVDNYNISENAKSLFGHYSTTLQT